MHESGYQGLLLIGDPHLEGRTPGFRRDDYANVVLEKLAWCLEYAATHRLLPAILGDLFDKPRDNPNWILVRLLAMLNREVIGLYGNHDVHYNPQLTDDDSLSVLVKSGRLRLLTEESPWSGTINGRQVIVGGSSYRQELPRSYRWPPDGNDCEEGRPLVIWLTHHDIMIPGYDEGRIRPREIPGIDLVINGHIHRRLEEVPTGGTRWLTPGNISRRTRSEASRNHVPSVLRIDIAADRCDMSYVEVPHRPFDEVFHEAIAQAEAAEGPSAFVTGLAELQARRTSSGAGLMEFLEQNVVQFPPGVSHEIMNLAREVMSDGN
jgi:DNA repair exonuclease SbcCD nuclease subunit